MPCTPLFVTDRPYLKIKNNAIKQRKGFTATAAAAASCRRGKKVYRAVGERVGEKKRIVCTHAIPFIDGRVRGYYFIKTDSNTSTHSMNHFLLLVVNVRNYFIKDR